MIINVYRLGILFEVLVDDQDYDYFSQFKWYIHKSGYVVRTRNRLDSAGPTSIRMHREVFRLQEIEIPADKVPDHINRNKIDNSRSNLRLVTPSENALNVSDEAKIQRIEQIEFLSKLPKTEKQMAAIRINLAIGATLPRSKKQIENARKVGASDFFSKKNGEHYKAKRIINIVSGVIYECIKIAAFENDIKPATLGKRLRNGTSVDLKYYEPKQIT